MRTTIADVTARVRNVNRRLNPGMEAAEYLSTGRYVLTQTRNGSTALDEYQGRVLVRTITVGTKREIYDFLHAMMVGIDLSRSV